MLEHELWFSYSSVPLPPVTLKILPFPPWRWSGRRKTSVSLLVSWVSIQTALGAVAVSFYSSVLPNEVTKYLPEYVAPAATGAGLPAKSLPALFKAMSTGLFDTIPGINPKILGVVGHAVKHAYATSFRTVFLCRLPFGFLILIAATVSPNVEDYLTDDVARKLHGTGIAEMPVNDSEKM